MFGTIMAASQSNVLVDYKTEDYRGFVFVLHEEYGLMLLRCTRKKNKPPHWQLPGGHIDEAEFVAAAEQSADHKTQLLTATRTGAARELFEETGIDVRKQLDRLTPAGLRKTKEKKGTLSNEYKHRLFYFLIVTDADFPKHGTFAMGEDGSPFKHVKLRLSIEHSGFTFQQEPSQAAVMLQHHSGGKTAEALTMAMGDESSSTKRAASIKEEKPVPGIASSETTPNTEQTSLHDDTPTFQERGAVDLLPQPERKCRFCCFSC